MERKYSKKREAILAKIKSTKAHPSAEWIYHQLKPEYPDLSLGTVYRNIAVLKEEGHIVSASVVGGQERLDGSVHPHPHFVCDTCNAVIDVDIPLPGRELDSSVEGSLGIKIDRHELIFHGTCSACLEA